MKRTLFIWVFAILSLPLSAQFGGLDVEGFISNPNSNSYYRQQKKEIENTIRSEVEAQARANRQSSQSNQSNNNQAVQSYNNRISVEGQQRMEYYNNPDNYINRDVTNRRSSYFNNEHRSPRSQTRDLGTESIHSENLNSKSLQSLREANSNQFSSPDEIDWDRPVYVKLFDEPNLLDEHHPLEVKHDYMYRSRQIMNRKAREKAEREKLENEVAVRNDIIDLLSNSANLVGSVILDDAAVSSVTMAGVELGKGTAGFLLSENINLLSEMAKYWNECSSGTKETKRDFNEIEKFLGIDGWEAFYGPEMVDSYEMVKNATANSAIGKLATVIGDKVGVAYVGMEQMGTGAYEVFTSLKIGLSLSNFAVNNEKSEE